MIADDVLWRQVGGRLKHGWFRDGVTHPNSDLPPDGLPRMTWEDKVMPYSSGNIYSYTPAQVRLLLDVVLGPVSATSVLTLCARADGGHDLDYLRCVRGCVHHGGQKQQRSEQEGCAGGN